MKDVLSIKQALGICLVLLALTLYYAFRIYQLTNIHWAEIPDDSAAPTQLETKLELRGRIEQKLNQITKDGVALPGGLANLLTLRAANGKYIDIVVLEGDLRPDTIDPADKWNQEVRGSGFLLNSVDEKHRIASGINESITISLENADQIRARFKELLTRTNKEHPRAEDVKALSDLLGGNKSLELSRDRRGRHSTSRADS